VLRSDRIGCLWIRYRRQIPFVTTVYCGFLCLHIEPTIRAEIVLAAEVIKSGLRVKLAKEAQAESGRQR